MERHVSDLVAELAAAFPQRPINEKTLAVYVKHLEDLDLDELAVAVHGLIRTSEFMPTVHAIREAVAENRLALPSEAEALIEVNGLGHKPHKLNPLVREALDSVGGSWALRTSAEPGVVRGQFLRVYRDLRQARINEAVVGAVALGRGEPRRELTA